MTTEKRKQELQNQTYQETVALLQTYRRATIVRPTGFRKTGILTHILTSGIYTKIMHLYPSDIVRQTVLHFYINGKNPQRCGYPTYFIRVTQ